MYVRADVTPGAKRESVVRQSDDHFVISVREPAAQNRANRRVQALVAQALNVPVRHVRIIAGHRSPRKIFCIDS